MLLFLQFHIRGNSALLAFEDLIELVPSFTGNEEILVSIFIIITKVDDITNAKNSFKGRISQHIKEINESIETTSRDSTTEYNIRSEKVYKKLIWEQIIKLEAMNHIFFINISDVCERNKILKLLANSTPIETQMFSNTLFTNDMKNELSNDLEMLTHTWTKIIIPNFQKIIPENISNCKCLIKQKNKQIKLRKRNIKENKKDLNEFKKNKSKYQKEIEELEGYLKEISNKNIEYERLMIILDEKKYEMKSISRRKIESLKQKLEEIKSLKKQTKNDIEKNIENLGQSASKQEEKLYEKERLSLGWVEKNAFKYSDTNPNEKIIIDSENSDRLGIIKLFTSGIYYEGLAGDFTGLVHHYSKFNENYRILIVDDKSYLHTNRLEGEFKYSKKTGEYLKTAAILGTRYEIAFEPHLRKSGIWTVTTNWKAKEKIPSFEIYEIEKSYDHYKSTIINLETEIGQEQRNIIKLKNKIMIKEKDLKDIKKDYIFYSEKLKEEKNIVFQDSSSTLESAIEELKENILKMKKNKGTIMDQIKEYNNIIERNHEEKKILKEEVKVQKSKRILFALIIKDKIQNLRDLREMCKNLYDLQEDSLKQTALKEIEMFIELSDDDIYELEELVNKVLKKH